MKAIKKTPKRGRPPVEHLRIHVPLRLPSPLVEWVNQYVAKAGVTRSKFIEDAVRAQKTRTISYEPVAKKKKRRS